MNALIRFHFGTDPTLLTDKQFAILWNDLKFCLTLKSDIGTLNGLFGNG